MSFVRSLLATVTVLTFAIDASAQFAPVPNSGCPGGSVITTTGAPQLGMAISYTWFCSARSDVPFMLFSPAVPPVFPLPMPIACSANCILIHPAPPVFLSGPSGRGLILPLTIPQDPSLLGQTLHNQGGCVTLTACIYLGQGLATTIQ